MVGGSLPLSLVKLMKLYSANLISFKWIVMVKEMMVLVMVMVIVMMMSVVVALFKPHTYGTLP